MVYEIIGLVEGQLILVFVLRSIMGIFWRISRAEKIAWGSLGALVRLVLRAVLLSHQVG